MPIVRFVCPHCEKPAEVQVTGVTRSRACPHCGDSVLLQVAFIAKDTGLSKRPALLVNSVLDTPVDKANGVPKLGSLVPVAVQRAQMTAVPISAVEQVLPHAEEEQETAIKRQLPAMRGPAYEPKELEGSVVERMRLDPEVRQLKIRLTLGAAAVAAALTFVFAGFNLKDSSPQDLSRQDAEKMLGGNDLTKPNKSKNTMVLMRATDNELHDTKANGTSVIELHSGEKVRAQNAAEETSAVLEEGHANALTGS